MTKQELTKFKADTVKTLEGLVEDIGAADSIEEVVTSLEYLISNAGELHSEADAWWDAEQQED